MKLQNRRRQRHVLAVAAKFSVIVTGEIKKFSTYINNETLAIVSDP
ncbi:hypothetical protein ACE103_16480 [Bradyrhizobium sp. ma5]